MNGEIVLTPWEFLAVAATPLSALSGVLKRIIQRRLGGRGDKEQTKDGKE